MYYNIQLFTIYIQYDVDKEIADEIDILLHETSGVKIIKKCFVFGDDRESNNTHYLIKVRRSVDGLSKEFLEMIERYSDNSHIVINSVDYAEDIVGNGFVVFEEYVDNFCVGSQFEMVEENAFRCKFDGGEPMEDFMNKPVENYNIKVDELVVEEFNKILIKHNNSIVIIHAVKYDDNLDDIVKAEVLYYNCEKGFMSKAVSDILDEFEFDADDVYEYDLLDGMENPHVQNALFANMKG